MKDGFWCTVMYKYLSLLFKKKKLKNKNKKSPIPAWPVELAGSNQ